MPCRLGIGGEFEAPQAPNTTVLVAGATGRVGRILVRKLLLRGYRVRALVRGKEGVEDSLPQSVQLVFGDLADYAACRKAVEGVDKVRLPELWGGFLHAAGAQQPLLGLPWVMGRPGRS